MAPHGTGDAHLVAPREALVRERRPYHHGTLLRPFPNIGYDELQRLPQRLGRLFLFCQILVRPPVHTLPRLPRLVRGAVDVHHVFARGAQRGVEKTGAECKCEWN